MTLKRLVSSFTIFLLILSSAFAQAQEVQEPPKPEQQSEEQKKIEQNGLALLKDLVAEAYTLKLPENRLRVLINIADLFWTRDQKRARAIFADVTQGFNELASMGDPAPARFNYIESARRLRSEALRLIAGRDASLAREFLVATRQVFASLPDANRRDDYEQRMEEELNVRIAASDPKIALQIGEEMLAKKFSHGVLNIIMQLQRKDRDGAAKLFNDSIKKLRSEDLSGDRETLSLMTSLFRMGSRPLTEYNMVNGQMVSESKGTPLGNDQMLREMGEIIANAGLKALSAVAPADPRAMGQARSTLSQIQSVMPDLEKYAPARAAMLRARINEFTRTLDPAARAQQEFRTLMSAGTVDDLLQAAAKAPPERRNQFFQGASQKAMSQGDIERARQIVNDNVSDERMRGEMLASIDRQTMARSAETLKLEDARQMLSRLRSDEQRATTLAQLATAAFRRKDKKQALQFLEEAFSLINKAPDSASLFNAQLQVANAYAPIEPARSFEIIEPLVYQLNAVIGAAAILDGFQEQGRQFRDGEFLAHSAPGQIGRLYQQTIRELASLARADFDRARAASDRFQHNETRVMAHLSMAHALLAPPRTAQGYSLGQ